MVGKVSAGSPATYSVTLSTGTYYNPSAVFAVVRATEVTLNGKAAHHGDLNVGNAADTTFDSRSVVATSSKVTRCIEARRISRPGVTLILCDDRRRTERSGHE